MLLWWKEGEARIYAVYSLDDKELQTLLLELLKPAPSNVCGSESTEPVVDQLA